MLKDNSLIMLFSFLRFAHRTRQGSTHGPDLETFFSYKVVHASSVVPSFSSVGHFPCTFRFPDISPNPKNKPNPNSNLNLNANLLTLTLTLLTLP